MSSQFDQKEQKIDEQTNVVQNGTGDVHIHTPPPEPEPPPAFKTLFISLFVIVVVLLVAFVALSSKTEISSVASGDGATSSIHTGNGDIHISTPK